jgi:ribonuclease HI
MSQREESYGWFTGTSDELVFPWYDSEAITFKDPLRSSTDPVDDDELEPPGPSFGPGADKGTLPQVDQSGKPSGSSPTSPIGETPLGGSIANSDAPSYSTHTIPGNRQDKVDVTFLCEGREVHCSVERGMKESMIQRRVANELQMNLNGYLVARVTEGHGYVGMLCQDSTVTLTPATPAQIQSVIQARTSATADTRSRKPKTGEPRKQTPPSKSIKWLDVSRSKETEVNWLVFGQNLERDKMVHIVTDGGARPNPGAAGWGVLMRQSGKFAINWGHWDMATNNAMEILAVVEALANIPDGMHVWVMTDSAYVKNGITQWVPNWIRNNWKNSGGARVSNQSLWKRLIAAVERMKRVEWSWVKK